MKNENVSLSISHLSFSYGEHQVLEDISFEAREGDLVAVLGPNGVGKSTLFRCMLGFLKNYSGEIRMADGSEVRDLDTRSLARYMAYIPQNFDPVYNYTVLDSVLMGTTSSLGLFSGPGTRERQRAEEALESVGVLYLRNRGISRISGGERQMVMIARALAQNARILVMDEPTANLDYGNQARVMERVRVLAKEGYTVLISTHNPEHALLYANRVLILQGGHVLAQGDRDEILTQDLLSRLYGIRVAVREETIDGRRCRICIPVTDAVLSREQEPEAGTAGEKGGGCGSN